MMDFLERIRQKPRKERKRIAFIATVCSFLLVFTTWWNIEVRPSNVQQPALLAQAPSPFEALADVFREGKETLSVSVRQTQDELGSITEVAGAGSVEEAMLAAALAAQGAATEATSTSVVSLEESVDLGEDVSSEAAKEAVGEQERTD